VSIELLGCDWEYDCRAIFWVEILQIAEAFGWKPAGTLAPRVQYETPTGWEYYGDPDMEWSGGYTSNDWQRVTDEDARAFSAALRRAIDAVMMESPLTEEQTQAMRVFETKRYFDFPQEPAKKTVARIAELAVFTSRGGFVIA